MGIQATEKLAAVKENLLKAKEQIDEWIRRDENMDKDSLAIAILAYDKAFRYCPDTDVFSYGSSIDCFQFVLNQVNIELPDFMSDHEKSFFFDEWCESLSLEDTFVALDKAIENI